MNTYAQPAQNGAVLACDLIETANAALYMCSLRNYESSPAALREMVAPECIGQYSLVEFFSVKRKHMRRAVSY